MSDVPGSYSGRFAESFFRGKIQPNYKSNLNNWRETKRYFHYCIKNSTSTLYGVDKAPRSGAHSIYYTRHAKKKDDQKRMFFWVKKKDYQKRDFQVEKERLSEMRFDRRARPRRAEEFCEKVCTKLPHPLLRSKISHT